MDIIYYILKKKDKGFILYNVLVLMLLPIITLIHLEEDSAN